MKKTLQRAICCPCGNAEILALGLCSTCYTLKRQDVQRFGGLREQVLERDGYRCRVCGSSGTNKRSIIVHHRRPGVSKLDLLIALCPGCHAKLHHIQLMDRLIPPLLLDLWREQHPKGREQIALDFDKREPAARAVRLFNPQRKGKNDGDPVKHSCYEIEPCPAALGGGWRLRLFGQDPETGGDIEMGGGVFPGESCEDFGEVYDAHADATQVGEDWLAGSED